MNKVRKYQKLASISKNGIYTLLARVYTNTSLESNLAINLLKFKMWYTTESSIPLLRCVFQKTLTCMGFPDYHWLSGKECQCRSLRFDSWVGKMPWRRAWQPTPVFLPGESHGQRSLVGYSPRGHKESDTTEATQYKVYLKMYGE